MPSPPSEPPSAPPPPAARATSRLRAALGRGELRLALAFAGLLWALRLAFVLRRLDLAPAGPDLAGALLQGALLDAAVALGAAALPAALLAAGRRRLSYAAALLLSFALCGAAAVETEYFAFGRNRFDPIFVAYAREWRAMAGSTGAQVSAGFLALHAALFALWAPLLALAARARAGVLGAALLPVLAVAAGVLPLAAPRQARTWYGSVAARSPVVELARALRADALASRRVARADDPALRAALDAARRFTNPFEIKRFSDEAAPLAHTGGAAPAGTWFAGARRPAGPLNVVYVVLEAFEADTLRAAGGAGLAPELDRLAQESLFFRNFFANGAHTPRALDAALCGLVPRLVGAPLSRAQPAMPLECLPSVLKRLGYETAFVHGGSEHFENRVEFLGNIGYRHTLFHESFGPIPTFNGGWGTTDEVTYRKALDFVDALPAGRPFLLTVLSISNHHPFDVPDPALEIDRDPDQRMNNTLRYTDREAVRFLDALRARGLLERTVVFVLGDHGLSRENLHAGASLHEKLLHRLNVPLLVLGPPGFAAPRQLDRLASQDDLVPTALDLLGLDVPSHAVGHSLGWALADRDLPVLMHDLYTGVLATVEPGRMTLLGLEETVGRDNEGAAAWERDETGFIRARAQPAEPARLQLLRELATAVNHLYAAERWWRPAMTAKGAGAK